VVNARPLSSPMPRDLHCLAEKKMFIQLILVASTLAVSLFTLPVQAAQRCEESAVQKRFKDFNWEGVEKNISTWKSAEVAKKTVAFARQKISFSVKVEKTVPIKQGELIVCDYRLVASLAEGTARIAEIRSLLLKISPELEFDGRSFVTSMTYTEGGNAGRIEWVSQNGGDARFVDKVANLSDIIYSNQSRYFPNK
jgi:hypothetical protein